MRREKMEKVTENILKMIGFDKKRSWEQFVTMLEENYPKKIKICNILCSFKKQKKPKSEKRKILY